MFNTFRTVAALVMLLGHSFTDAGFTVDKLTIATRRHHAAVSGRL